MLIIFMLIILMLIIPMLIIFILILILMLIIPMLITVIPVSSSSYPFQHCYCSLLSRGTPRIVTTMAGPDQCPCRVCRSLCSRHSRRLCHA